MFVTSQITRSLSGSTCPLTDDDKYFPGPIDKGKLLELEKESDMLSRKVQKRLKQRDNSKNSKGFIQKVFRWHHQKKMDKIKFLMNSLFPKLTKSEKEVSQWLKSVTEEKEIAWQHGNYILHDIELQIERFQTHLDFVDEVINDIKQLDYDVFKEIREIKAAFAFNQEIVEKFQAQTFSDSSSITSNESSDVSRTHEAQEHPSLLPAPVETMAQTTSGQTSGHECEAIFTKTVVPSSAAPTTSAPVTCHIPAVWQGVKVKKGTVNMVAKSPFTKSLGDSSSALSLGTIDIEQSESERDLASRIASVSEDRSSHSNHAPHDISDFLRADLDLDHLAPCVWDGADSKRKSLQSMTVSLTSLKSCPNQSKQSGCKTRNLLGLGRILDNFSSGNDSSHGERSISADSKSSESARLQDLRTRRNRSRSLSEVITDARSLTTDGCSLLSDSDNDSEDATSKRSGFFSAFSSWSGKSSPIQSSKRPGGAIPPVVSKTELTRSISLVSAVSSASDESGSSSSSGGIACSNNYDLCTCRTPVKLGDGLAVEDPATFSDRLVSDTPSPSKGDDVQRKTKKKRRLQEAPDKIVSVMTLLRQIDEKNYSTEFTDSKSLDYDQIEMLRRIEKCLLVKESLKSILLAMELTREKEMTSLRGVKRLKNNLKEAIVQYENIAAEGVARSSHLIEAVVSDSSSISSQPSMVGLYTVVVVCSDGPLQHFPALQLESGDATPQLSEEADNNSMPDQFAEPSSRASNACSRLSDNNSSAIISVATERREQDTAPSTPPFKSAVVHALTPTAIADSNSLAEVTVCVGHLTKLLSEEIQAKERLAKLANLIINVQTINKELTELEPPAKDELSEA